MTAVLASSLVLFAIVLLYWFPVRHRYLRWGATGADLQRAMPGDRDVQLPNYDTTVAVTIDSRPDDIWPWLMQMGYRRGGLYSYDWLDRLFGFLDRPSAERVLPEFQDLKVGDVIPIGRGGGFAVKTVDPYRALVLAGEADGVAWAWQFGLYPLGERRTRLVSRNRARYVPTAGARIFMCLLEPAAFIMTRKMLLGIKRRAERRVTAQRKAAVRAA
jgi:hypothetical protein